MSVGKEVRLNRIFSHPSGKLCSVAVDHFIGYTDGIPAGLLRIKNTLADIVSAAPDAVTMHIGIATHLWHSYAGRLPLILQSIITRVDDTAFEDVVTPEDAARLGADALAVAVFLSGDTEARHLRVIADKVRESERFGMPIMCHVYPRVFDGGKASISYRPKDIARAVRCAVEVGADIVKVPYCGDVEAYARIVEDAPVRVVAAGGPQQETLRDAMKMVADVMKAGAYGATIGRNIWGFEKVRANVEAFKAIIHDGKSADEAMKNAGL